MRSHHFGNVANNALHNALLLEAYSVGENVLPIRLFGLNHAIFAPAREQIAFDVPDAQWVGNPDWSAFPDAQSINLRYSDLDGIDTTVATSEAGNHGAVAEIRSKTSKQRVF